MRAPLLSLPAVARAAGFALVAAAIVASAIHLGRHEPAPRPARMLVAPRTDPLTQEITRCEALGMAAEQDARCQAAWAENRQRFLTYRPAESGSRTTQTRNPAASKREDRYR
jgi:conjugative transfer region protein TrbK